MIWSENLTQLKFSPPLNFIRVWHTREHIYCKISFSFSSKPITNLPSSQLCLFIYNRRTISSFGISHVQSNPVLRPYKHHSLKCIRIYFSLKVDKTVIKKSMRTACWESWLPESRCKKRREWAKELETQKWKAQ